MNPVYQAHKEGVLDPEVTVKSIMDTWTLQKGYPVLHIKLKVNTTQLYIYFVLYYYVYYLYL